MRLAPHNAKLHVALGWLLANQGDDDGAITEYNAAIRFDQKNRAALINRGNTWVDKAEHERAILDYTTAIWISPQDVRARFNRGFAYSEKGRANKSKEAFDRGLADFTEVINLDPQIAMATTIAAPYRLP